MSEKHNEDMFETSEASLVLLSIASAKLRFTKLRLAAMFFIQYCPKSVDFLP